MKMRQVTPNKTVKSEPKSPQIDRVPPSAREMRAFARKITPYQWGILITSPDFIKAVETNLDNAGKILNKYFPKVSP